MLIGRKEPIKKMRELLNSRKSEFLAVTGRRRVGKTYLIDEVYKEHLCFRMTGIQDATIDQQLFNFQQKITEYSELNIFTTPSNWQEAFLILKSYLKTLKKDKKRVIFIDELPWVATARSGFLQLLAHLWNDYLSKEKHFILVVCGSSTSWIVDHVMNDTGGLHNRITESINLPVFNIQEAGELLKCNGIHLTAQELTKTYMILGGIPFYLEQLRKGENSTTAIERLCFSPTGILRDEYNHLFKALFKNPEHHETMIEALANAAEGLTHHQIIENTDIPDGGTYNRTKEDLMLSGFIEERIPFGHKKKEAIYKLVDEFSIFYHRFMKNNRKYTKGMWNQLAAKQTYKIWQGFAFESFCYKHIQQIKDALGIGAVYTEISILRIAGDESSKGFQIDLIIDRADNTINLCEMKFYDAKFKINKSYAMRLAQRKQDFIEHTQTKKQVFTTLISTYGISQNKYAQAHLDAEVHLDQFIEV
ncbi:MAG: ATP-binding protein [Crocinitomicaceae bacterium]